MDTGAVEISFLADRPSFIPACAAWAFGLWGCQMPDDSYDKAVAYFAGTANKDTMPLALVAHRGDIPVGMACLSAADPDPEARPDLTPWLTAVYVHPSHRGGGLAQRLVLAIEQEAARLGFKKIYLITEEAKGLYEKTDWDVMEKITTIYGDGILMGKALG